MRICAVVPMIVIIYGAHTQHIYGARVLCYVLCVLFIRIEIRALDLIHLNIYGRDMRPNSSNKSDREPDERANGHKEAPNKAK